MYPHSQEQNVFFLTILLYFKTIFKHLPYFGKKGYTFGAHCIWRSNVLQDLRIDHWGSNVRIARETLQPFSYHPTVTEPTAKAKTSVRLVMVTATPACFRVSPIASDRGRPEKNAKIILNKSSNKDDICVKRNILGHAEWIWKADGMAKTM